MKYVNNVNSASMKVWQLTHNYTDQCCSVVCCSSYTGVDTPVTGNTVLYYYNVDSIAACVLLYADPRTFK